MALGRILVCDDEELITELLRFRLESRGYTVDVASDGADALNQIQASQPDLVVLDAMMPVMEGYEVLRRLREDPLTKSLPVIMLTARRRESDVVEALQLGADDFIIKPFIPEELVVRIARLLPDNRR